MNTFFAISRGFLLELTRRFCRLFFFKFLKQHCFRVAGVLFPVPDIRYVLCLIILSFTSLKFYLIHSFRPMLRPNFCVQNVTSYNPP